MTTNININMGPYIDRLITETRTDIERSIRNTMSSISRSVFYDGRYNGNEGLAHEIIRKKVEDFVLSPEFETLVDETMKKVVDEETTRAVRALINSKARKHLFEHTYGS